MVPTHKFSALANVSALANARSVIIGDASLRPILDVNEKAGFESRLYIPVPDGSVVCVELAPSQTKILLAIASAWHEDEHSDVTDGWRGYRTFDVLGEIYAEIAGRREPIYAEAVRKYVSRVTTKVRNAALSENVPAEVIQALGVIRRPRYGYQIGRNGLEIRGL